MVCVFIPLFILNITTQGGRCPALTDIEFTHMHMYGQRYNNGYEANLLPQGIPTLQYAKLGSLGAIRYLEIEKADQNPF